MIKEFGGPIGQKYSHIDRAGRKALDKEDEITKFPGFGENVKNRFLAAFAFTPESAQEIQTRIVDKISQIAEETGIGFILADRDVPLHGTIQEGLYQGQDESERQRLFDEVQQDDSMKKLTEGLTKTPIEFKYLLIDRGNVILTAVEIPDSVLKLREKLSSIYAAYNLKPLPMEHILHITIGRMTGLPEEDRKEQYEKYRDAMIRLRHEISSNPLKLIVADIFREPTLDFARRLEK